MCPLSRFSCYRHFTPSPLHNTSMHEHTGTHITLFTEYLKVCCSWEIGTLLYQTCETFSLVTFYSSLIGNNKVLVLNHEEAGYINDGASILGNGQLYKECRGALCPHVGDSPWDVLLHGEKIQNCVCSLLVGKRRRITHTPHCLFHSK